MTIFMRKIEKDAKKGLQYLSDNGIIDAVFCKKGGTLWKHLLAALQNPN